MCSTGSILVIKPMSVGKKRLPLFLILILAIALRIFWISSRPIWYDEAFAILFAEKGPSAMLIGTLTPAGGSASDVHPLAYYVLLWGWMRLFGDSLLVVRSLSVLFGIGLVVIVYLLGRDLFTPQIASWMALFTAFSPFQIHYSQEIRMYAMLAFLSICATWALWNAVKTSNKFWWGIYALLVALALYTHNLAGFYLLPLSLTPILSKQWRELRRLILALLVSLILYLPWMLQLPAQFSKVQSSYWTSRPGAGRLVTTLLSFTTNLPIAPTWLPVALFVTILAFILAMWIGIKSVQSASIQVRRGMALAYLAFTPPLFLFLVSQWQPIFIERALLPSGATYLMFLAWSYQQSVSPKLVRTGVIFFLLLGMGMGIYQHLTYQGFPYAPYKELAIALRKQASTEGVIIHSNKLSLLPLLYYDRGLPQVYVYDPPGSGVDTLAAPTRQMLGLVGASSIEQAVGGATHVWLVIFTRAISEYQQQGYDAHPHLQWLTDHFREVYFQQWGDVRVYEFDR